MASSGTDRLFAMLQARIARVLADRRGQLDAAAQPPLDTILSGIRTATPSTWRDPESRSACRLLPALLASAAHLDHRLAEYLQIFVGALRWTQTYERGPVSETFFDNYGHAALVGPDGPAVHAEIKLGILVLGPGEDYPDHAHPAGEFYLILAGHPEWRIGSGHWHSRRPGDLIHHPSEIPHATRTRCDGLLALYAWYGTINVPPRFIYPTSHDNQETT